MRDAGDDTYRVVIDESSLDWRTLSAERLANTLVNFANLLEPVADGRHVAIMEPAWDVTCWKSVEFAAFLYTPDPEVPRDERLRLAALLDKCRTVDPTDDDIPCQVSVDGGAWHESSWGLSHALARVASGRTMACLVVPVAPSAVGWTSIELTGDRFDIFFLSDPTTVPGFWQEVIIRENTEESEFFTLTGLAFPDLIFAESLRFHRFQGNYSDVVPWMVRLLSALNDKFAATLAECRGDQDQVMARFSALGLDISPESPNTRRNRRAWAQRLVKHDAVDIRCEWHGKRLPDRDRVHFSLPLPNRGGKVFVGIFTDHLDT